MTIFGEYFKDKYGDEYDETMWPKAWDHIREKDFMRASKPFMDWGELPDAEEAYERACILVETMGGTVRFTSKGQQYEVSESDKQDEAG